MAYEDPLKKSYIDLVGTLTVVSVFAGSVTLSTQFIIDCPGSLLQTCLEISAHFFLVAPLAILGIYGLLHGVEYMDNFRRYVVVFQFILVEIMMTTAFLFLAVAILEFEGPRLGWDGIALVAALAGMLFTCHITNYLKHGIGESESGAPSKYKIQGFWLKASLIFCVVLEYAATFSLLGNAIIASIRTPSIRYLKGAGCPNV